MHFEIPGDRCSLIGSQQCEIVEIKRFALRVTIVVSNVQSRGWGSTSSPGLSHGYPRAPPIFFREKPRVRGWPEEGVSNLLKMRGTV